MRMMLSFTHSGVCFTRAILVHAKQKSNEVMGLKEMKKAEEVRFCLSGVPLFPWTGNNEGK